MRSARRLGWIAAVVAVTGTGCASLAPTCEKVPIVVAKKEERSRVEMRPGPARLTPFGTVESTTEVVPVVEHWAQDRADGKWHRVSKEDYQAAAPGAQIEVCR